MYPQSIFWIENKKNYFLYHSLQYKSGVSAGIHYTDMLSLFFISFTETLLNRSGPDKMSCQGQYGFHFHVSCPDC